jgi:uncharacterized membrane protein
MTLASVTAYNVSLFLHITAVMVGFGSTFALSIAAPVAMLLDPRHLPYVHRLGLALNKFFATPALIVVIATGLYQVSDDKYPWDLGDAWLSATFAIVIVLGGLTGAFFIPTSKRLQAVAERDIAASAGGEIVLSEEYQRGARLEAMVGPLAGVLLIVAVFLMVTKPGA